MLLDVSGKELFLRYEFLNDFLETSLLPNYRIIIKCALFEHRLYVPTYMGLCYQGKCGPVILWVLYIDLQFSLH